MAELAYGRARVLRVQRATPGLGGLRGLSPRFWAAFGLGAVLTMVDSFETMAALAWTPVPGDPGLFVRHARELNPLGSALAGVSLWLLPAAHLVELALFVGVCWLLTRDAMVRRLARRRPTPLLVRLGVPGGAAWVRLLLWTIPVVLVLTEGAVDLHNALVML